MSEWTFKVINPRERNFANFDDNMQPYEYYVRGSREGFSTVVGCGHNLDDAFDDAHLKARLAGVASM